MAVLLQVEVSHRLEDALLMSISRVEAVAMFRGAVVEMSTFTYESTYKICFHLKPWHAGTPSFGMFLPCGYHSTA